MSNAMTTATPVGFIGLGIMGAAMARNVLKAGFKVTVHNRSRGSRGLGQGGRSRCGNTCRCGARDGNRAAVRARYARRRESDPCKVRDALLGGSAKSFVLENQGKRLLDGTLQPGFRASLMLKDIKLALGAGTASGACMPVTALGAQMFAALCATGRDGLDNAALGLLFEELSGVKR